MVNSVVLICPQTHKAALNGLGESLGYGPDTFTRPLSADGAAPATHSGTHVWAQPDGAFMALVTEVLAGRTPQGLEAFATPLAAVAARVESGTGAAAANWDAALIAAGLTVLAENE
jgi:hypothetical protein